MGCFTAIILVLVGFLLIEIAIILVLNGRNKLLKTRVQYLQEKSRLLEKSIKDNQERFENDYTQLLNSQQLKPSPEYSWGQKEYEHYKSKQK